MLAAAIPVAKTSPRQHALRHLSRRGLGPVQRRDQRRFGTGMVRMDVIATSQPTATVRASEGFRLFAHTFGAAFLFVTVFLA
jgi:hypothetical protein